ncbi:MBL fold metallo-hydrolase [Halalkalibacter akibai]|uniref:Metal-dependent hydrolase n=1 Tax=Halalkalibacter akibai (strain ATCC 43226 / DSM 21942 / CIP 109018 / JCM 9157 / 1139) TaxID=1236973 RepID=W4QYN6_HALA3|nr:MBL fold metallo-hydrolase [Halalkalibacter akibai]GAE36783.1 metal-dependent hydrolase [Halalkalibacter akibai JCM 9157]
MKLTVVGYWHGYPEKGEATSGYLLEQDQFKLLLDCGSGVLSNVQHYCQITDLDAIVLSHYHHDHQTDIGTFQYARIINKGMGTNMKEATIYGHRDDPKAFAKLEYQNVVNSQEYNDQSSLTIGPFTFTFKKTQHPVPCYAMKIKSQDKTIVYTADSSYFSELADFAKEADLLIAECSGYETDQVSQYGHMNSRDVGLLANQAQPAQLLLSHLPHKGDHKQLQSEVAKQFFGVTLLARAGLTFNL